MSSLPLPGKQVNQRQSLNPNSWTYVPCATSLTHSGWVSVGFRCVCVCIVCVFVCDIYFHKLSSEVWPYFCQVRIVCFFNDPTSCLLVVYMEKLYQWKATPCILQSVWLVGYILAKSNISAVKQLSPLTSAVWGAFRMCLMGISVVSWKTSQCRPDVVGGLGWLSS